MKININLFNKKVKFPIILFVATSLAALALLPIFILSLKSMLVLGNKNSLKNGYSLTKEVDKKEYDTSDPFITKVPQLKDIIKKPVINESDPTLGANNSPITIVEFSDFECEFCRKQETILKQIIENFSDKVRLIWKDYPENNLVSLSFQAAQAARCANEQNHFWEYHDLLFNTNNLNKELFVELAEKLNLNLNKFQKCLNDDTVTNLIQNNIEEANALDINGVPFLYINDIEIMGQATYEELKRIVESELKNTD